MTAEDKFRRVLNERLRGRGLRVVKLKPISNPLEQSLRRVMPWGVVKLVEHTSCTRAWDQELPDYPAPNGDCTHLIDKLDPANCVMLEPSVVYWCGPLTVHEALPMASDTHRQFCRVSFPSDAPWYEGYTRNPLGIEPTGPTHAPRAAFMGYRP